MLTRLTRWRGGVRNMLALSSAVVLATASFSAVASPADAHVSAQPARATAAVHPQSMPAAPASTSLPTLSGTAVHPNTAAPVTGSPVATSVSRSANKLDVFGVDGQNRIYTTAWEPGSSDGWHRGTQINGGVAAPGTSVYGVSRRTDYLDIFAVGADRGVYTAAWTPSSGGWLGWWRLGALTVAPNTSVHAVSVGLDRIDIFAIGSDYGIYTTGWSPSTGWAAWTRILGGVAAPGTTVFGVSRAPGMLDIFAVGSDHSIDTAARPYVGAAWLGWWGIRGGVAAPNTSVFPVSRSTNHLDIFAVGADQHIYTAAWEPGFTDGWHGWWSVAGGVAAPNTTVYGVSRSADHLDIFAVGTDQHVYTAAWEPAFTDGFHGWWAVATGVVAPGTSVFGVSRSTDHLDVFAVGTDLGLYTAAWEPAFTDGFHGWWRLGNGQINGNSLTFSSDIHLSGFDPGWATLTVYSNGAYNFSGHFHESDAFAFYKVGIVWVLRSASGTAFVFSDNGSTVGTVIPGSSTHDWNVSGSNPVIAASWADLQAGYSYNWQANSSFDFTTLFNDIKTAIGYIKDIVMVVSAL